MVEVQSQVVVEAVDMLILQHQNLEVVVAVLEEVAERLTHLQAEEETFYLLNWPTTVLMSLLKSCPY